MRDLNINFIRYFVTLIDCGKFGTAAEQLHLSQPALSKSILTLEDQIGTPLLNRYHHCFELTDAGRYFYETSVYFLQIYDDFLYDIASRTSSPYSGIVKVSASGVILDMFFPEIISALSKSYPSIKIFTLEEDTNATIQSVLTHKAAVGTCLYPLPEKYRNSFASHHLTSSAFHIVFPDNHPFASKESVAIEELAEQNLLTPGQFSFVHQEFLRVSKEHRLHANIVCPSGSASKAYPGKPAALSSHTENHMGPGFDLSEGQLSAPAGQCGDRLCYFGFWRSMRKTKTERHRSQRHLSVFAFPSAIVNADSKPKW